MDTNISGKTVVVTGATSGIGLAAAEALVRQGAFVIGVGRSAERCREAERRLNFLGGETGAGGSALYLVADLALQSQVRALAAEIRDVLASAHPQAVAARPQVFGGEKIGLDGLINNAGAFTYWLTLTPEGFEMQWAVNYLAPFLLTHELLPLLQAAPSARVVTVSSDSHYGIRLNWEDIQLRRHYDGLRAYGQTKLASILFSLELNRILGEDSTVHAFAADPGLVKTDIGLKGNPALVRWVWARRRSGGVSPEESAKGIVYLVSEPSIQNSSEIYWKDGAPKKASKFGLDAEAARRLWEISEQMCGMKVEEAVAESVQ